MTTPLDVLAWVDQLAPSLYTQRLVYRSSSAAMRSSNSAT
jgi:hypothetical protein